MSEKDEADGVPSEADWSDYWTDLDSDYAHTRFGGKTIGELIPYFVSATLGAIECIGSMPDVPFQYYLVRFGEFIKSPSFTANDLSDTADGAHGFLALIKHKLNHSPDSIVPIMNKLSPSMHFVAEHQSLYQADVEIYGSFLKLLEEIEQLHESITIDSGHHSNQS